MTEIDIRENKAVGVKAGGKNFECDAVVSAVPVPRLLEIVPEDAEGYKEKLRQIKYLNVELLLLKLKQPLTDFFLTLMSPQGLPMRIALEYYNANPAFNFAYFPFYLPEDGPEEKTARERLEEITPYLKSLNKDFTEDWIAGKWLFRDKYVEPVYTTGFSRLKPDYRTPFGNLYVAEASQSYPYIRGLNSCAKIARGIAGIITEDYRK